MLNLGQFVLEESNVEDESSWRPSASSGATAAKDVSLGKEIVLGDGSATRGGKSGLEDFQACFDKSSTFGAWEIIPRSVTPNACPLLHFTEKGSATGGIVLNWFGFRGSRLGKGFPAPPRSTLGAGDLPHVMRGGTAHDIQNVALHHIKLHCVALHYCSFPYFPNINVH